MIQLWGNAYLVDLPVERLRFDPDPWGLNGAIVALQRCQAAVAAGGTNHVGGLSPESAGKEQEVTEKTEAGGEPAPLPLLAPVQISACDVHGFEIGGQGTGDRGQKSPEPGVLPRWFLGLVRGLAWGVAVLHRLFVDRLVLSRPRLRVVREG